MCLRRRTAARRQNVSHLRGLGNTIDDFEIPIYGTHCETALRGEVALCADSLPQLFPEDQVIRHWGVVGYARVLLVTRSGHLYGLPCSPL